VTTRSKRATATAATEPGPLVGVDWLAAHLDDDDLRVVHVGHEKRAYNKGHVPGAVLSELHRDLALKGTAPETGDAERGSLLPSREQLEASLRRWRVGEGDRVVFYDDAGLNRHATRAYWLLRRTGYPAERLHVVDGGLEAWRRAGQALTADVPEADLADGLRVPVRLSEPDSEYDLSYEDVLALSAEATKGATPPTRLLDVRTASEFVGQDVRARRAGAIPGARQRAFEDFVTPDGTFHSVDAALSLVRAGGVDPDEVRVVYCHSGVRSSLVWFVLHELAGLDQVRNYAGSWEEWGNREDSPVSLP
jgi:thiosulfate/3-mercaptopyruvate sulfurtransferase